MCTEYEAMQNRLASIKKVISHDFNETARLLDPTTSKATDTDFCVMENLLPEETLDEQDELVIFNTKIDRSGSLRSLPPTPILV